MPEVELERPDIDDIHEGAEPFKRIVAVVVALITLFGAIVGFLQNSAGNKEEEFARETQRSAITGLGEQLDSSAAVAYAYGVYSDAQVFNRRRVLANSRRNLATNSGDEQLRRLQTERWKQVQESLTDLSPLLANAEYTDDPFVPQRFQADVTVDADIARLRQFAQAELVNDYGGKADAYVAVLTVLAVSLFLVGLSLTITGRGRRFLFVPGLGLALVCVAWTALIALRPVHETPERAIRAVAEGNRLLLRGELDEAISQYDKAVAARGDYGIALGRRADAKFLRGSPQSAAGFVSVTDPEAVKEAIADGEKAVANGASSDIGVVGLLGFTYFLDGRYGDAARLTNQALDINDKIPELWFNLGLIELARGKEKVAKEHYDKGIALANDIPEAESFIRFDLFAAVRTDLEILVRNEPERKDLVEQFQAYITAAEFPSHFGRDPQRVGRGAELEVVGLGAEGVFLDVDYEFDGLDVDTGLSFIWYFRPDDDQPFHQPAALNRFEFLTQETVDAGAGFHSVGDVNCLAPGEYRLDVYAEGRRLARESIEIDAKQVGSLVPERDDFVGVDFCRPDDWVAERDNETMVGFASPDGTLAFFAGTLPLPAELGTGTQAADTVVLFAAGSGRLTGPLQDITVLSRQGRIGVFDVPDAGRVGVIAIPGQDGVVRVLLLAGPDDAAVETLKAELLPTVRFDDLNV